MNNKLERGTTQVTTCQYLASYPTNEQVNRLPVSLASPRLTAAYRQQVNRLTASAIVKKLDGYLKHSQRSW